MTDNTASLSGPDRHGAQLADAAGPEMSANETAPSPASVDVVTLGCRLNAYESEVMRAHAESAGLDDTIIINTCAVTAEAIRQASQTIRRLRRERPNSRIVVTGCAAQIDPDRFASLEAVDHVVGNAEKLERRTFDALAIGETERVRVNDIMSVRETAHHLIDGFGGKARAYVQVQNGCDHRCTFCIIPFGRGPSRSVPAGAIVDQVAHLVDRGHAEIVLTGVDITSSGTDLPGEPKLGTLVRQILKHVPKLKRLRLSSIDQVEADADLMRALRDDERLMPHLHLSMQSGDDMILKRMKRRHLRADAIAFCDEARALRPDVVFGADLIAGFPTETDAMFANTLDIIDRCSLTYLHVFPFSAREGTPAARMPQLPRDIVRARAARLRDRGNQALQQFLNNNIGRHCSVLIETPQQGRTPQFATVHLDGHHAPGELIDVTIIDQNHGSLIGTPRDDRSMHTTAKELQ